MATKKNIEKGAKKGTPPSPKPAAKKPAAKKAAAKKKAVAKPARKLSAAQMAAALRGTWLQKVLGNVDAADRVKLLEQLAKQGFDLSLKIDLTQLVDKDSAVTQDRMQALAKVLAELAANPELVNATDIGIFCSYPCNP